MLFQRFRDCKSYYRLFCDLHRRLDPYLSHFFKTLVHVRLPFGCSKVLDRVTVEDKFYLQHIFIIFLYAT
jgi:hypothetical protein